MTRDVFARPFTDWHFRVWTGSAVQFRRRTAAALTPAERDAIERFVTRYIPYPTERLREVLDTADYIWLCWDDGHLVATTAVRRLRGCISARPVTLIYTAMVAVDPDYRRHGLVPGMGMRTFLLERFRTPLRPIYWFALAASPSGYLQMARNYEKFWPRHDRETPPEVRALLEQGLAALGITGIDTANNCLRIPLEFGISDRRQDPSAWDASDADVRFFLRVNPGYFHGSDLACLCPLSIASVGGCVISRLLRFLTDDPLGDRRALNT